MSPPCYGRLVILGLARTGGSLEGGQKKEKRDSSGEGGKYSAKD